MRALSAIRKQTSKAKVQTTGLSEKYLKRFERDPLLLAAISSARAKHLDITARFGDSALGDEVDVINDVQKGVMNFYDAKTTNPYVALAAKGPWIITSHGAVIYDSGGYGMLGFGHNPPQVMNVLGSDHVMANIMTPSFSQKALDQALRAEIGHSKPNGFPYDRFVCLNSGSECVSLAMRIADVDNRVMTGEDGPHAGRESVFVCLKGSFHGRTEAPAMVSDSCTASYAKNLGSHQNWKSKYTVEPNNVAHLKEVFEQIDAEGKHVELMLMEPVMGEGNPGVGITREFYDAALALTEKYRSLLLVDSIQAGLRTNGVLSIMDYPDFSDARPPDFEVFSKAISSGQYPISILMLGPRVPEIYVRGLYGNTMTSNPRAQDIVTSVLETFTPEMRENIRDMGEYFKDKLRKLQWAHPDAVTDVTGTGLLVACHLDPKYKVVGVDSVETLCRKNGLGVIHGGANALRYTPWFNSTPAEIDLIAELTEDGIEEYRRVHDMKKHS